MTFINTSVPICRHRFASKTENIKKQTEINLSGHFLLSRFELTRIEIIYGRAEGHLTCAS